MCNSGVELLKQVHKRFDLDKRRQLSCLTAKQEEIYRVFKDTIPSKLSVENLFGEEDNMWKTNTQLLKKLSLILKWFGIPLIYKKLIVLDDDIPKEHLIRELYNGKYDFQPDGDMIYHDVKSGNFEQLVIFYSLNPKTKSTITFYFTSQMKNGAVHCHFCGEEKSNEFEILKCIHTNHPTLWTANEEECSVCNNKIKKNDQIHHYELKHKLADAQYITYLNLKKKLNGDVEREIIEDNPNYTIIDSHNYIKKLNTSHVTIDISFDYETFTAKVDHGDAIPYMLSLSLGCNFHYTHGTIPDHEKFKRMIKECCLSKLEKNKFIVLNNSQEDAFYIDPLYKPLITAYTTFPPRKMIKNIDEMTETMKELPTTVLDESQYKRTRVFTLNNIKDIITERFIDFLYSLSKELNFVYRKEYADVFGTVQEVIIRPFAYNGARFDNYFIEQYLKFCNIPKISRTFANRQVLQGKDGISKIFVAFRYGTKKYKSRSEEIDEEDCCNELESDIEIEEGEETTTLEESVANFQLQIEVVDILKMRAPTSLANQVAGSKIKDLKFKMNSSGHVLMHEINLGHKKDIRLPYPTVGKEWTKWKTELLGRPIEMKQYDTGFRDKLIGPSISVKKQMDNAKEIKQWDDEFEECINAHRHMFAGSDIEWKFSQYYISYGIKDSISCYALMLALYNESVEYLEKLNNEGLFNDLQRDPNNDDEEIKIKSLDYFKLGISTSGLAFRLWHISKKTFVQPKGIAAETIRESIIGGFCQPQMIGEIKSGEDFCWLNNHFTQIDIVSMYANAQRSNYYADGTCEVGTEKVKKSIDYCNRVLDTDNALGMIHYLPIFGFYALAPPTNHKDRCSLGPVAIKIKMVEHTGRWCNRNGLKTTENITWCGIPRFQCLSPQDALTYKNMGWTIRMIDTPEAVSRTVLFETFRAPLKHFAEIHIKLKLQAKKDKNVPIEKICKLIGNGLYGKTLMKPIYDQILTITSCSELTKLYTQAYCCEIIIKNVMECSYSLLIPRKNNKFDKIQEVYYIVKIQYKFAKSIGPVHYGSQILGHSHAQYFSLNAVVDVHKGLVEPEYRCPSQIYGDTDSWFVLNGVLCHYPSYKFGSFMAAMPENPFNNNDWCVIVEEKEPFGIHGNSALICGKKSYCFITDNDEPRKTKELVKAAKGQKLSDLRGIHYRQVIDKKLLSREKFEDLYEENMRVETERLSFMKSLFNPNDKSPIVQTKLKRELQVNYSISRKHKVLGNCDKFSVRCIPHSASEIEPNEEENTIKSIEILDSRSIYPDLLIGEGTIPTDLYKACYYHYAEYMEDENLDRETLLNHAVVRHNYDTETQKENENVYRYFKTVEDFNIQ